MGTLVVFVTTALLRASTARRRRLCTAVLANNYPQMCTACLVRRWRGTGYRRHSQPLIEKVADMAQILREEATEVGRLQPQFYAGQTQTAAPEIAAPKRLSAWGAFSRCAAGLLLRRFTLQSTDHSLAQTSGAGQRESYEANRRVQVVSSRGSVTSLATRFPARSVSSSTVTW